MHHRKFDIMEEYLENINTPVIKRYKKLSDVPREPSWTFSTRYEIEARNHHYLNTNPIRIESWTADIARAHLALSDSVNSSSSENSSSSSQSSSSSSSSSSHSARILPLSTSPILRSPTHSRRPSLYQMNFKAENMYVQFPPGINMNILLENTKNKMLNSFLTYSARDNNCQNFILALLQSNFLDNPRNVLFTKQSTSDLFDANLRRLTNTITDIAQKVDIIREGGSLLY